MTTLTKQLTDFNWEVQQVIIKRQEGRDLLKTFKEKLEILHITINRYREREEAGR